MCLQEIGLLQVLLTNPHLIVNIIRRTYVFKQGNNKHAILITISKYRRYDFCQCFHVELLVQHFYLISILIFVDMIGRSWRTLK